MQRKTKYRIRRQKKNKTKRRINKLFRGKTYKKLYNNRRFTGGMMRASSTPSAEVLASAIALGTTALVNHYRNATAAANQYRTVSVVGDGTGFSYTPTSLNALVTDPSPYPIPPPPQESPHPRSLSHIPLSPPYPPPYPPPPPSPSPPPLLSDYSQITSDYLLDKPPTKVVEKAQQNLAPTLSKDLIILPKIFPSIDGVDWTTIIPKLLDFYELLGQTLGPYEVHLIMTTTDRRESNRIRREVIARIEKDRNTDIAGNLPPGFKNLKRDCKIGVCHSYEAKNGKIRYLVNIDIGEFYRGIKKDYYFNNLSNEDKEEFIIRSLRYFMAHEYYHIFQLQLKSPVIEPNGLGAEDSRARWGNDTKMTSGEKQPHAISRWWTESFATIMPFFLGASLPKEKGMLERVKNAIENITSNTTLTKEDFSYRMMYTDKGYLFHDDRQDWAFLAAAYMAQQTSWDYLLGGHFYKDFQRIRPDTPIEKNGETVYVPDTDNIWLHNFGMTQKDFLHNIFNLVRSGEITVESLRDVLPGGKEWYIRLET